MSWKMLQGDVFDLLPTLAPGSVDAVVTSPPYWQLRSYLPKGHALKPLELGSEPTIAEYIGNMVRVFSLVREAMAEHGVCWINVGDTYCDDSKWGGKTGGKHAGGLHGQTGINRGKKSSGLDAGNLCLIPQRLAIALQDDGWLVRSVVVWHKPAPMPASVAGWAWRRCRVKVKPATNHDTGKNGQSDNRTAVGFNARWQQTKKQEHGHSAQSNSTFLPKAQWSDCPGCPKCLPNGGYVLRRGSWRPTSSWEPVLMLAKRARYFADGEPVKKPSVGGTNSRAIGKVNHSDEAVRSGASVRRITAEHRAAMNASGANLRDVWSISAESLHERHYAAFPTRLVAQCLKASVSEKGYCAACGKPWVRMIESKQYDPEVVAPGVRNVDQSRGDKTRKLSGKDYNEQAESKTIGWRASCSCGAPTRPGLVLDPFCGSGRTGIACRRFGFDFVGLELNPDYVALAERKIEAALRHTKRPKVKNDSSLFG